MNILTFDNTWFLGYLEKSTKCSSAIYAKA